MRRGSSRFWWPRPTGWCRAAPTLAYAGAVRCNIWRRQLSSRPKSGNCSTLSTASAVCGPSSVFAPLRGPEFAYRRRARLGRQVRSQKGPGPRRFSRTRQALPCGHTPLRDTARKICRPCPRSSRLSSRLSACARSFRRSSSRPAMRRAALVFRVMQAPSAEDLLKLEQFAARQGVAIYLQSGGLETIRPLIPGGPAAHLLASTAAALPSSSDPPISSKSIATSITPWSAAAMDLLHPVAERHRARSILRSGQFHAAAGAGAPGASWGSKETRRWWQRRVPTRARNGVENADFFVENLFEPAQFGPWAASPYDLVLLDPPRAGAVAIMERMAQWRPRRVVYISCHPGSLARDAGILVQTQDFQLIGAGVMDMFPHTTHVESIAVFERGA